MLGQRSQHSQTTGASNQNNKETQSQMVIVFYDGLCLSVVYVEDVG
jgi:hypothetical protein